MTLDDLSLYLQTNGVTPVYKDYLPPEPDTVTAVYETGGLPPTYVMSGPCVLQEPRIQVICRSDDLQAAHSAARSVYELLSGLKNQVINGVLYHWVGATQEPFLFGRDQNARFAVACNYEVKKDRST